jgi:hypothetical protein
LYNENTEKPTVKEVYQDGILIKSWLEYSALIITYQKCWVTFMKSLLVVEDVYS